MKSKLILGTMRFSELLRDEKYWVDLLCFAYDAGITRLHCSSEYESYPLLVRVLRQIRQIRPSVTFEIIVKLAEPNFGEIFFDPINIRRKIDEYRTQLGVDQLLSIQWMWRGDLDKNSARVSNFSLSKVIINDCFSYEKSFGRVEKFHCFPYSREFAIAALSNFDIDGFAFYRNFLEKDFDFLIHDLQSLKKSILVIRPFGAGKVIGYASIRSLIDYSASLSCVDGLVISCSTINHIQECIEAERLC
jgi:hypothetical protein